LLGFDEGLFHGFLLGLLRRLCCCTFCCSIFRTKVGKSPTNTFLLCSTILSFILFYYFVILIQYYFAFLFFFLISGPYYSPPRLDEIIFAVSVPYNFKHYRDSIEYFGDCGSRDQIPCFLHCGCQGIWVACSGPMNVFDRMLNTHPDPKVKSINFR